MEHKCNKEWEIQTLLDGFNEIKNVLLPSEFHPDNGLVNQFEKLKKQQDEIRIEIQKMKTTVATAISVVGGIIAVIELASKFMKA